MGTNISTYLLFKGTFESMIFLSLKGGTWTRFVGLETSCLSKLRRWTMFRSIYLWTTLLAEAYSQWKKTDQNDVLPRKLTYPLKNAGWKMNFPFEMVLFLGTC